MDQIVIAEIALIWVTERSHFNHLRTHGSSIFVATISIWPPPSLEGGLGRELARTEVTVFTVFFWLLFQFLILDYKFDVN